MPFIKISGLTTATAVSATNQFEINQNGGSRSATVAQVAAFARTSATDPVVLPAGTVSAPALTFTGDTNTGIYSPAADTIAFTEGGVEAMRIDTSGNVGIGTASPGARLGVSDGTVTLITSPFAAGSTGYFGTSTNHPLAFVSNNTERMRVSASGDVGIGTSSPAYRLDVSGQGRATTGWALTSDGSTFTPSGLSAIPNYGLGAPGSNVVSLAGFAGVSVYTNQTERMRVDQSGNVGIGTSSPSSFAPFTVARGATFANQNIASFGDAGMNRYLRIHNVTAGGNTRTAISGHFDGSDSNNFDLLLNPNGGNVGIGTGAPGYPLTINRSGATDSYAQWTNGGGGNLIIGTQSNADALLYNVSNSNMVMFTNSSERMRITNAGNVGIGTSAPVTRFHVSAADGSLSTLFAGATRGIRFGYSSTLSTIEGVDQTGSGSYQPLAVGGSQVVFTTSNSERMRIDAAGNVGIGTSAPGARLDVSGNIRLSGAGPNIEFNTGGAMVYGPAGNTLAFASGGGPSAPIERARITDGGGFCVNATSPILGVGSTSVGFGVEAAGGDGSSLFVSRATNIPVYFNRNNDGTLVAFQRAGNQEGNISVSGSTVSYNGGHLARWSQLPNSQRDPALLKGTVLSNLDEMCVWLDAEGNPLPNEQLNRVKVSDVEGDPNVAGVFVNWDNDDQANPYDMNIAMTGDMIIRIAAGVAVQKGILLMSAGDGTAKPQGDDIVRSKTIAKVTSNHVTCTYPDGSYCVPCVLMAC